MTMEFVFHRNVIVLLLLIGVVNFISLTAANTSTRVINGENAVRAQFTYQVSVRRKGFHVCGGAIISRNYILTAAQCVIKNFAGQKVEPYATEDFNARVGSTDLYSGGTLVDFQNITVHPAYAVMLHNVALLHLKQPLIYSANIQAIPLSSTNNLAADSSVAVSGWGYTKANGDTARHLQWLNLYVTENSKCLSALWGEEAEESLLCLRPDADGAGICTGDTGTAAEYNGGLVGIASFVLEHCGSTYPDGFTNLAYYIPWIKLNSDVK